MASHYIHISNGSILVQVVDLQQTLERERHARQQEGQAAADQLAAEKASHTADVSDLKQRLRTSTTRANEAETQWPPRSPHAACCQSEFFSQLTSRRLSHARISKMCGTLDRIAQVLSDD